MHKLPFTLPSCGQRAAVRLELYGRDAAGDPFGSLDAVLYCCRGHGIETVTAVWVAGLTVYEVPMAPDVERICGESYVFPTGNLGGDR